MAHVDRAHYHLILKLSSQPTEGIVPSAGICSCPQPAERVVTTIFPLVVHVTIFWVNSSKSPQHLILFFRFFWTTESLTFDN